jgi:hypothetical protein
MPASPGYRHLDISPVTNRARTGSDVDFGGSIVVPPWKQRGHSRNPQSLFSHGPAGQTRHLVTCAKRRDGNSKPRGQPSLIATIINTDSTPTWTTYEPHYPDSKRVSSTGLEGANARRTSQDLVGVRRASARRPRFHNQNLVFRRAAVANKKEADPTPRTKTSEQALRQMRTGRTGGLPRHPRPNWSSGR